MYNIDYGAPPPNAEHLPPYHQQPHQQSHQQSHQPHPQHQLQTQQPQQQPPQPRHSVASANPYPVGANPYHHQWQVHAHAPVEGAHMFQQLLPQLQLGQHLPMGGHMGGQMGGHMGGHMVSAAQAPPMQLGPANGGAAGPSATVQRSATKIKKDAASAGQKRTPASAAVDGQRVWDGHQFRVIRRCPHGKIRKDLCKGCNGSGICEHGKRRNGCIDCGGPSICEHKRPRRRCVDCGGKDVCEHKLIRHFCRECQKAGTGGKWLCEHGKRKVHCRECKDTRICRHNKPVRQCKFCSEAGLCKHHKEKGACSECRRDSWCSHKRSRYTCIDCKELRAAGAAGECYTQYGRAFSQNLLDCAECLSFCSIVFALL